MAYNLTYWKVTSPNTAEELKSIRLKSVDEVMPLSLPQNRPKDTNCILLERTDKTVGRKKTPNIGQYTRIIYMDKKAEFCSAF